MKNTPFVLLVAFSLVISGCMSMKPTDRVVSRPAVGQARGPVYYLPLTALGATIPISIVEYELVPPGGTVGSGGPKYYAAEIREDVKIQKFTLPDPDQRYCIQSGDLSDNPFLLSNLSFEMSGLGLLTSVSAEVNDQTLDALAEAVKLVGNIARGIAGVPPAAVRAEGAPKAPGLPDKSTLTEVKVLAIVNNTFIHIPIPGKPETQTFTLTGMPSAFKSNPISYTDLLTVEVKGPMPSGGVRTAALSELESCKIEDAGVGEPGVFYRTPKYMEILSAVQHDFGGAKLRTESTEFTPLMQFGDVNSLVVQAKRFTKRTTTATFADGILTKYGVNSESSAKKALEAVNGAVTEARSLRSELAALKEQEQTARLAEQKNRFDQLKKLREFYACTQTPGCDSTQKLTELIESLLGFSDE